MDHFAEHMVKKRPSSQDRMKQGLILAAAVILSVVISVIAWMTGWIFLLVLIIGAIYGAYYLMSNCSTEYEYTVTNGELDVDKILGKRKRVHLLTVQVAKITAFGAYTDQIPDQEQTTRQVCSDNTGEGAYYADASAEGYGAIRLIFTPSAEMISTIALFLPASLRRQFK